MLPESYYKFPFIRYPCIQVCSFLLHYMILDKYIETSKISENRQYRSSCISFL